MSMIGTLIKEYRKNKKWTQKQLGEELAIPQVTVSAWETGKQLPREKHLEQLEKLGLDPQVIDQALQASKSERQSSVKDSSAPSQDTASDEQKYYLEEIDYDNAEIWLLSPKTLPVIGSEYWQGIWADNLSKGVTYCILLYLDFISEPDKLFREMSEAFYQVEQQLKEKTSDLEKRSGQSVKNLDKDKPVPGKVNLYATQIVQEDSLNEKISAYRQSEEECSRNNLSNLVFHRPKCINNPKLIQYMPQFGSSVMYRHRTESYFIPPLVLVSLAPVKVRPSNEREESKRVFYFLSDHQAKELDGLIKDYLQRYQEAEDVATEEG